MALDINQLYGKNVMVKRYKIYTNDKKHFNEMFNQLVAVGFVYSTNRFRTTKEIFYRYGYYCYILIGYEKECKMVLHGSTDDRDGFECITIDKFLINVFPNW
jgi:hypothetical protein